MHYAGTFDLLGHYKPFSGWITTFIASKPPEILLCEQKNSTKERIEIEREKAEDRGKKGSCSDKEK